MRRRLNNKPRTIQRSLAPWIILLLVLLAGLYFLSTQASEVPTSTIEVEVNQAANAQ
jgi:hypothetical protein